MFPYVAKKVKDVISVKKIVNCFHIILSDSKNDNYTEEKHDFWEIVYIQSGKAVVTAEENSFVCKKGDIIFHKPNELHNIKPIDTKELDAYFISFEANDEIMKIFENVVIDADADIMLLLGKLLNAAEESFFPANNRGYVFAKEKQSAPIGALQAYKLYLELFLIEIAKKRGISNKVSRKASDTELYIRMNDYICERIYGTFKVEHMCTEFHYSKTYLSAIFKKHSNMTMQAFYMSKKIEEAKKLLLSTNHSIAEIADMLSFANPYHFSNAFKKHIGYTPSRFRKSLQS